jgi:hypothetical protein
VLDFVGGADAFVDFDFFDRDFDFLFVIRR